MDEIKPKSRRGRKPKIKENNIPDNNDNQQIKKKRGRKKKCEMNIENTQKISGYNPEGESIDTIDDKIKFSESYEENVPSECENVTFGLLQIKRHNIVKKETKTDVSSFDTSKCMINFNWIKDNLDDETKDKNSNTTTQKKENNLTNFFNTISEISEAKKETKKKKYKPINYKLSNNDNVNRYIKIMHNHNGVNKPIPKKTDILCWWCCHQFDGIPRFIPTKYDEIRQRFKVTGCFCSWACAKAFILNDSFYINNKSLMLLVKLIRTIHGRHYDIPTAPPRSTLRVFGGTLDIKEFRNVDKNIYYEINTNRITMDENYYVREILN
jgi:hypothetical protein